MESFEIENINSQSITDAVYGSGLMQTRTPYSTAVQVIKPRNMELVEKRCISDASIAGDSFLYQWEVKEKQKDGTYKKKPLIGLSIGAALSIARNMGNNALDVTVEEKPDAYFFYAAYIDLETGFNLRRAFRQRKQQKMGEKYKEDGRAEDIVFQIGQSKALRNVSLNAAPVWLTDKVLETAKNSFGEKVEKEPEKYKKICITLAGKLSIGIERVELKYGKQSGWDARKIVSLLMELRTVEDGLDDANSVFPSEKSEQEPTQQPADTKAATTAEQNQAVESPVIESVNVIESTKDEVKDGGDPTDLEKPSYWIERIKLIDSKIQLSSFQKKHKRDLETFSGDDYKKIIAALEKKESEINGK